jgi:hypothetical protein
MTHQPMLFCLQHARDELRKARMKLEDVTQNSRDPETFVKMRRLLETSADQYLQAASKPTRDQFYSVITDIAALKS